MKVFLTMLAMLISGLSVCAQRWIKAADARQFKGELVNIVGYIDGVKMASNGAHQRAMLTFVRTHSVRPLKLVIAADQLPKFKNLPETFLNNYVHVKGRVIVRKGVSYMLLTSPEQITIVHEAPEYKSYEPL